MPCLVFAKSLFQCKGNGFNSFIYPCKDPDLMLLCICGDVTSAFN